MFQLTRAERTLVAGLLLAFVVGLAVKHYRAHSGGSPTTTATTATDSRDAKR